MASTIADVGVWMEVVRRIRFIRVIILLAMLAGGGCGDCSVIGHFWMMASNWGVMVIVGAG